MAVRANHDRLAPSTRLDTGHTATTMLGRRRSAVDLSKQNARVYGQRHDSLLSPINDRHDNIQRLAEQAPLRHDIIPRSSRSKSPEFYRPCSFPRIKMLKESAQSPLPAAMELQREGKNCLQCLPRRSSNGMQQARQPQQRHARHVPALPRSSPCRARMASQHFQAQI